MEGKVFTEAGSKPQFQWEDPFFLDAQLTDEERMVRDAASAFASDVLMSRVIQDFREESFDPALMREMGQLGLLGPTIPQEFGGAGLGHVAYGVATREIERIDSGYRSAMSVQSSLVMHPIFSFGSDEQKSKFLPKLATAEIVGCFGLTEPDYGSDPGGMVTKAVPVDGGYHLSGAKTWISNAPYAEIAIVWAKLDGIIRGFIVERKTAGNGFTTPKIVGKLSLRASITGSIQMDNAFVPEENLLPHVSGLKGPFSCLNKARYGIAWGVMGAAEFCWHAAREYALDRKQFNKPIASNQLIQKDLVDCQTQVTLAKLAALKLGRELDKRKINPAAISLLKRNNCLMALDIARKSRDILGGNGISEDYHVIRHLLNLETVNTYEGTSNIHSLILGRSQTGIQAFY